jgi:hypothetical protein
MVTSARIWPNQPYIIQRYLGCSELHAPCKDYQLGPNFLQYRLYGGMGSLSAATPSRRLGPLWALDGLVAQEQHKTYALAVSC